MASPLNFPSSPGVGAIYSAGGGSWVWDGTKWEGNEAAGGGGSASISIGTSPPASPSAGWLWFDTNSGNLYCYYTDVDSSQWVIANSGVQGPQGPAGAASNVTISDTAPTSPYAGDLWFDSVGLQTYIFYNDGNSTQWIPTNNQLGSSVPTTPSPPPNPQNGNLWWDSVGGQLYCFFNDGTSSQWIATSPTGQAQGQIGGYLSYVSATQLQFLPFNGNQIQINGLRYTIPNAGIAGLTNTGCYVEGVANQSLAAATLYRVYCFNNAGTLTADFSQTAHATSTSPGNSGVEIRSGDDTRTFLGLVLTQSNNTFVDSALYRYIRSWVNRKRISFSSGGSGSFTATSATVILSCYFVCFADEALIVSTQMTGYFNVAATFYCGNWLDGAGFGTNSNTTTGAASSWFGATPFFSAQTTEGSHTAAFNGSVSAGTLQYYAFISGTIG